VVDAYGDHRIAMAMGVAALLAQGPSTLLGGDAAAVSYPGYWSDLGSVTFANEPPVKTPS
jgi:3-phosphoshikimate 1-carboxyvinyltransferase